MIGEWSGTINYTNPYYANGKTHNFSLIINSSNECMFRGFSTFEDSNTSFNVSGSIDIYGWVSFIEDDYNAPEIRKGDRVYVNLDWGNSALTDETFKKRIVDATHWILEILPDSDKQICNICKGQQIRYNRPSFDDEFACLCSEGYTVAKIHTDNKNYVSFHNSKGSLASEKVRIIGRLVQIVKEI